MAHVLDSILSGMNATHTPTQPKTEECVELPRDHAICRVNMEQFIAPSKQIFRPKLSDCKQYTRPQSCNKLERKRQHQGDEEEPPRKRQRTALEHQEDSAVLHYPSTLARPVVRSKAVRAQRPSKPLHVQDDIPIFVVCQFLTQQTEVFEKKINCFKRKDATMRQQAICNYAKNYYIVKQYISQHSGNTHECKRSQCLICKPRYF